MSDRKAKVIDLRKRTLEIPDTDLANAERFLAAHRDDIRFTDQRGWYNFDGTRWRSDEHAVMRLAKGTVSAIFDELRDADKKDELFRWAKRSRSRRKLEDMIVVARSEVIAHVNDFDPDPFLLNCANGVVDLRTGQLTEHAHSFMCSRISPVEYQPGASCPRWLKFLREVFDGDDELVAYLQRAIGYSLCGDTSEQVVFFFYGLGANGKSVLLLVVVWMLGEYAATIRTESVMLSRRSGNSASSDIARLAGARFVAVNETNEGARLNEALLKDMTGGDTICARFLYQPEFEFRPQFKLWIRGNHKPLIRDSTDSIWRRIHLVPFTVQFDGPRRDPHVADKLRQELPGILKWAIDGCIEWQRTGLNPPDKVRAATAAYRDEMDVLGQFINDCCCTSPEHDIGAKELFSAYRSWAEDAGIIRPMTQTAFGSAISERGYTKQRTRTGIRYFGMKLR